MTTAERAEIFARLAEPIKKEMSDEPLGGEDVDWEMGYQAGLRFTLTLLRAEAAKGEEPKPDFWCRKYGGLLNDPSKCIGGPCTLGCNEPRRPKVGEKIEVLFDDSWLLYDVHMVYADGDFDVLLERIDRYTVGVRPLTLEDEGRIWRWPEGGGR